MLSSAAKNLVLGNIQLIEYCDRNKIDLTKLNQCNIERMGNKYFFVMPKENVIPSLDNDIASQPTVVLTMDTTQDVFTFENIEGTAIGDLIIG